MKKSDLWRLLAQKEELPDVMAKQVIELIFDGFAEELIGGGRIEVRGLGSFKIKEYRPYGGRNPKTSQAVSVPPKNLPFFKVSKNLHERLNEKKEQDS